MHTSRIALAAATIAGGYLGALVVLFPRAAATINRHLLGG